MLHHLRRAYRRTGADLPGGDRRRTHRAEMEGWFWRFTDAANGRVVVVLCGINRHPDGDWGMVAVAAHPGGVVRSAVVDAAVAAEDRFHVRAGDVLRAEEGSLRVRIDGVDLSVELGGTVRWPHRLGGVGLASAIPWLGHYWHPHVLGGDVRGRLDLAGERWDLGGADVYAERNWGAGFPDRWWWGQAQGFADPDLCVAFGGGRVGIGPLGVDATGCVLRLGDEVVRFVPPTAVVRTDVAACTWSVTARAPRWRLRLDGDAAGTPATALPVPLPAERRTVPRDLEHMAGRLRVRAWRRGRAVVDDETDLAALEVGALDPHRFAGLAAEQGLVRP